MEDFPVHTKYATDRETLERECTVEFVRDSGPGGAQGNKRETGVRLYHAPSGLVVTAVERRSQAQNLDEAYERLIFALKKLNHVPRSRKATRVPFGARMDRLASKRIQSARKAARRRPDDSD